MELKYYFVINENNKSIEGYSKKESTAKMTLLRKREKKPNVEYTLREGKFGEPIEA